MLNTPSCIGICKRKFEQPPCYFHNDSNFVCFLKKSLYGIKNSPWAWYAKMDIFLLDTNFFRCHYDPNVYTKKVGNHINIIHVLYVVELIFNGSNPKFLNRVKLILKNKFDMEKLGYLHYSLASKYCNLRKEFSFPIPSMHVLGMCYILCTSSMGILCQAHRGV
jgi:hypothetical protein